MLEESNIGITDYIENVLSSDVFNVSYKIRYVDPN